MSDGKLTATITMKDVPPGDEEHHCVVVELPNAQPVWVNALHATLTAGSHHLIVDRNAQSALITTSQSCSPTMAGDATRLLIAQQRDTRLALPSGVAYRLDAHQHIFLQLHFINVTEAPATIAGTVELSLADAASTPKEAKSMFTGATNIMLQPKQPGSAKFFSKLAAQGGPLQVFALTSHTHQLGVRSTIERVASADAAETTPLHESLDWAEPPLTQLSTPLKFDGSDGLRLTCRYMNTTDRTVSFGTSANDEMCFMWLYYYQ